jgi:pimeloyl-ACP methyl ester carboxylesterase
MRSSTIHSDHQTKTHPLIVKKILVSIAFVAISLPVCSQSKPGQQASFALSADSIRLAYDARGEGTPALVFVHGWSCDRSYWNGQQSFFSKKFKVVTLDLAGHGESGLGREAWTMESYGKDVAAVVEKLDLRNVILIGHSMGGDVIAEAAFRLRDRVTGLIMVDAYKKIGTGRSVKSVEAFIASLRVNYRERSYALVRTFFVPTSDKKLVEQVAGDMSSAPEEVALGEAENALKYSREIAKSLQRLKLPVVAINPDNEPTDMASMKQNGVEVIIMKDVGHFLMMEDPERFNSFLEAAIVRINK